MSVTAGSGEAALALLPGDAFDVVLTDLQLPGLRGHALATALRSALVTSGTGTRLLGMSGSEPSKRELSAFDAFLLKPFTAEQFAEAAAGSSATPSSGALLPPSASSSPTTTPSSASASRTCCMNEPGFEVVGEAEDGDVAITRPSSSSPTSCCSTCSCRACPASKPCAPS
jgi:CheY-like chemotaxis protein